jgi:hypothetical protein
MKLSRTSKVGVFLLTAGAVTFLGVAIWLKTTREILADFPMPMHGETISRDFSVEHDGPLYKMRVHFGSAISETTARCLLGATKSERYPDLDCRNIKPAQVLLGTASRRSGWRERVICEHGNRLD